MGEIKKFDFEIHNYGAEIEEAEFGEYIKFEDHLKAIAEAKKEGVREFLTKIRDHCRDEAICVGCPMLHINCNTMSKVTDEEIQKVEGI